MSRSQHWCCSWHGKDQEMESKDMISTLELWEQYELLYASQMLDIFYLKKLAILTLVGTRIECTKNILWTVKCLAFLWLAMEGTNYFICLRRICNRNPDRSRINALALNLKMTQHLFFMHYGHFCMKSVDYGLRV